MSWPAGTVRDNDGRLVIGGLPIAELAAEWGTPLYLYDEATLRGNARRFREAFAAAYPRSRVVYAGKAGALPALLAILHQEGLGLDVVSGGEISAGLAVGVPAAAMTFHGNNKGEEELRQAVAAGVGLIALDNEHEIDLLTRLAAGRAEPVAVLLRLNPAIAAHTHEKIRTGALDSKFGFPIATGAAAAAAARVAATPSLDLVGYHAHVGSQIFDPRLVRLTVAAIVGFAAEIRDRHGIVPRVVSPGGGFGVADDGSGAEAAVEEWAREAGDALREACGRAGFPLPELVVEPGRAIVGPAGVALYTVGARKAIPGVRTYVSVDGGMADNIRPSLYGARYGAALANRDGGDGRERVTIAGKYCESGDVLIDEIELPALVPGDLLAVPMVGAYCLAMASNYNLAPRPAVLLVDDGRARLIRRRETIGDLLAADVVPAGEGRA